MEGSSRRGFLRSLMRESARSAQEAGKLLREAQETVRGAASPPAPPAPPVRPATPAPEIDRAQAAARALTVEELLELAAEHGLEDHLDDVRALARHSIRITSPTRDSHPAGRWLYEPSDGLVPEEERPIWNGERLTLVAQVDLADPALRDVELPLPGTGRLVFLWAALQAPSGQLAEHAGAWQVLHVPSPLGLAPTARLSVELTIPRVWAAPVQALGLDAIEHDGYLQLRRRLATLQDVELDDGFGRAIAFHRVLGYPNETGGLMPTTCEVTSEGRDAVDLDATDEDIGIRARRWRLLLQLTVAGGSPWNLGGEPGRLYFWIPAEDLEAGDFSRVWAIAQPGL
jgi:hypothetical protein